MLLLLQGYGVATPEVPVASVGGNYPVRREQLIYEDEDELFIVMLTEMLLNE